MISHRFALPLLLAVCFLWPQAYCAAQPAPSRLPVTVNDVDDTLDNEWFGVYFQGDKIGYFNNSRTKVAQGNETFYREKFVMSMKLQSLGQKMEMKIEESLDFEAKPPFRLLRADYVHTDDKIKNRTQLAAKDKNYEATITVNDVRRTKMLDDVDYCLADSISTELWIRNQAKKGEKLTTRDLDLDELRIELSTATLTDTKESLVNGVKVKFHEVQSLNHKTNIVSEQKLDEKGRLISGTIAGVFELRRESEADAKNTKFSSDLFILGMATLDKPIGDTANLKCLVLEVKSKEARLLPDGPRQTLEAKGEGIYHLCIGQKYGKLVKATDKDIKEALTETVAYPIHDAKVLELAKKAAGDAKTDEEKAKNICKFVKDYITPSLEGTLPKMHDLLDRKKGDCKSYALMFTCLARAVGLPSREVSGFVYMGNDIKGFGGHAWNEVLLDGYWVPVDASMNQVDCDATHICLGTDKESSNNLLKSFGKLSFKLVQVER
jgi:hypothetical protein